VAVQAEVPGPEQAPGMVRELQQAPGMVPELPPGVVLD